MGEGQGGEGLRVKARSVGHMSTLSYASDEVSKGMKVCMMYKPQMC